MSHLIQLFEQHSYIILFVGIFLELMALPISGELLMSYAGYFVYQGKMNYVLALLTVLVSGGAGITATYWIGRAGGYNLIDKYGKFIHLGPERYNKMSAWFERSGSKLLVFAYFIPGVRHFTGYVSGTSRMPFKKFIIPAYIGSFLWGLCFVTLGKVLGPRWKVFHEAASKYFVIFIIVVAVLLTVYFLFRFYKTQIKDYFIQLLDRVINRFKTIRAAEIFLAFLTLALIGMVTLMLGLAQDYLYNDFTEFNQVTVYLAKTVIYKNWMKVFLVIQNPYVYGLFLAITILRVWRKGRNRILEFLLLIISILGANPYHQSVMKAFSYLKTLGFVGRFHSANFPDLNATLFIIILGTCVFLLVRHSKRHFISVFVPISGLVLLIGVTIANIALNGVLPSDIVGGYVYGGVWIFFNFLLFEMLRLVLGKENE